MRRSAWCLATLAAFCCCLTLTGCGASFVVNGASDAVTGTISPSPASVDFGSVDVGQPASSVVAVINQGSGPVQVSQLTLSGASFAIEGQASLPVTLDAGGTLYVKVQFDPSDTGTATGQLTVASNAKTNPTATIKLKGTGVKKGSTAPVTPTALSCSQSSMTGSGTDACTVTLSGAAPTGGLSVSLSSSSTAVTVPASVTVPANATSADFTATVASVTSAQTATLTAKANSTSKSFALQLNAYVPTLTISTASLSFGSIALNTPTTQSVTLTSSGTAPVTVNSASITGTGFTRLGASFPMTLNAGQTAKLTVQFDPTVSGAASGQLSVVSNSTTNPTAVITLSGTGASPAATVSALSCSQSSMTGSGTDACTVTLSGAAPTGGLSVSLSSSSTAVTVPASVTVPANATSAAFTATVASVTSAQTATLTAKANSTSKSFALQLNAYVPTLSLSTTTLAFGNVTVGQTSTLPVTLSSTGTAPVTISAISVVGSLFTPSGVTPPVTLNPGQSVTLNMKFTSPQVSTFTGVLTITSNSSTNPSAVVNMSAAGVGSGAALTVNATSVAFGSVVLNTPATQSLTLTSTGTSAVTVSSATVTGTGFTVSGAALPVTLNPGQTATLNVQFDPTATGAVTGQLTIVSNSSSNPTITVSLSATGAPHEVQLNWSAPSSSSDPVAGYNIYRSSDGGSTYQEVGSIAATATTYMDSTVQSAQTYDYTVRSVDASGTESTPSNMTSVTIP